MHQVELELNDVIRRNGWVITSTQLFCN